MCFAGCQRGRPSLPCRPLDRRAAAIKPAGKKHTNSVLSTPCAIPSKYTFHRETKLHSHPTLTSAQQCRSEREKFILDDVFSSALSQFKKYHPSGNLKFI